MCILWYNRKESSKVTREQSLLWRWKIQNSALKRQMLRLCKLAKRSGAPPRDFWLNNMTKLILINNVYQKFQPLIMALSSNQMEVWSLTQEFRHLWWPTMLMLETVTQAILEANAVDSSCTENYCINDIIKLATLHLLTSCGWF